MADLKDIKGLIWDLDGTLYRFNDMFKTACNHAAATAACKINPSLDYGDALQRSIESEERHGFSLYWYEHQTASSYQDMHFAFHEAFDEKVIDRNEAMAAALRDLTLPSVILTNASRDWVKRILDHLGMGGIFGDGTIIALEDVNFEAKSKSGVGFEKALGILGLPANDVLLVEDLERNLPHAKALGLKTALVHHGLKDDQADMADFLFSDTLMLMQELNVAQGS